jgi:hypothetical protein
MMFQTYQKPATELIKAVMDFYKKFIIITLSKT